MELDGVAYHLIDSTAVPTGYASVPVKLVDDGHDGEVFDTYLIAGSVDKRYTECRDGGGNGLGSLRPVSKWRMFIDTEV